MKNRASLCIFGVTGGKASMGPRSALTLHIRHQLNSSPLISWRIARISPTPQAAKKINPIRTQSPSDTLFNGLALSPEPSEAVKMLVPNNTARARPISEPTIVPTQRPDAKGKSLKPIPYKDLDLSLPWESFDLAHELTPKGIQKFVADYRSTLTIGIVIPSRS